MLYRGKLEVQDQYQQKIVTNPQLEHFYIVEEVWNMLKPVLHNGQLFYKFNQTIFVLNKNQIERAPESYQILDTASSESTQFDMLTFFLDLYSLFSFNGKLYNKQNHKLYVKKTDKFVFVRECKGFFAQFCDKVLMFCWDGTFKLNEDLSMTLISNVQQQILFIGCNIISYNEEEVHIFDMITETTNIVEFDEKFKHETIYEVVELGCTGLQLKTEILSEVFGAEYPQQLKQYWDNYMNKHCEQYPIYLETVKNLIPFSQLCQHYNEKYRQKAELQQRSFETHQFMNREKQTRVVNALSTLSQLLNQASNCLANISQVESYQ
ncbi:Conserved_hypothetical protein [Hexamita inflata]|uniref:Uncharacterized protein n=1 Tax=Hexamita inflata TaxID=28002 RepID=A0AA86RG43_9EUKA|nr:Conserved hypothetical protein [Hexamita inflata]